MLLLRGRVLEAAEGLAPADDPEPPAREDAALEVAFAVLSGDGGDVGGAFPDREGAAGAEAVGDPGGLGGEGVVVASSEGAFLGGVSAFLDETSSRPRRQSARLWVAFRSRLPRSRRS